jgi:L-asparaginase II
VVEVTRGGTVESWHRISAAVVDERGVLVAWVGDPERVTFFRSAAKPLQALPLVADGAADAYELSDAELAVCCASHSGEPAHVETVRAILGKIGCREDDLECGPHWPFYKPAAERLRAAGRTPSRLHNNCSGKHAGMLAWARHRGVEPRGYRLADHPVQVRIRREIAEWTGSAAAEIPIGIDGCGVITFAQRLDAMAGAYARLAARAEREPASPAGRVVLAMTEEPFFVGGTGRLTTRLMEVTGGRLLAKFGAEAVYCVTDRKRGWGVAVKVEDGQKRAVGPALLEVLAQLDMLTDPELLELEDRHAPPVKNTRGEIVGAVRARFRVQRGR